MCMMCMVMHTMHHEEGHPSHANASQNDSLLEILRRRYALGEINREQFEEMQRVLGVTSNVPPVARASEQEHHE